MPDYRLSVGDVEIIALLDTPMEFPWHAFFPGKSAADFEPYRGLYPEMHGERGLLTAASCYAIRSKGKTILCDTGIGPGPFDFLGGLEGHLLEDMNTKGVQPESVDIVIHSHLHTDHVGWNLSPDNVPNFPKAQYYAPRADWDAFTSALDANAHVKNQVVPLKELGRLELYSGETAMTTEVVTLPSPGHTPGHSSLVISSAGEKAIIMGDIAHHPAQIDHSDWCCAFDFSPDQAAPTRENMLNDVESTGALVAFPHFKQPGFGRIVRLDGKRVFQAL